MIPPTSVASVGLGSLVRWADRPAMEGRLVIAFVLASAASRLTEARVTWHIDRISALCGDTIRKSLDSTCVDL
jgi:hypothetical protein